MRCGAVVVLTLLAVTQTPVFADLPTANLVIQNEADYLRLRQAAIGSQVVLMDLERDPNNRIVGVLAGILHAAAENKRITQNELQSFAAAFDSYLQNPSEPTLVHSGDIKLLDPANFMDTVRFGTRAAKQPGMRADFGLDILRTLGVSDESAVSQQERLIRFLDSQALDLVNNASTNLVITFGLFGLDADGCPSAVVRAAFVHYLNSQGIDPFPTPAILASDYQGAWSAMAAIPGDYADLQSRRASRFLAMHTNAIGQAGVLVAAIPDIIDRAAALDAYQRTDYVAALVNPNQDRLNTAVAQRIQDMDRLSRARSLMNASISVIKIAGGETEANVVGAVGDYLSNTARVFAGAANMATLLASPSPVTALASISGLFDIAGTGCGLFGADEDHQKLEEIQDTLGELQGQVSEISNQITEVRLQMLDLQQQLNHRLNAVDASLDGVFVQLGNVQVQLSGVRESVYELQSDLNRVNQNLFGALQEGYQHDFIVTLDAALGYEQRIGFNMPFLGASSFQEYESTIYSQVTTGATSETFAGPNTGTSQLTTSNADTLLDRPNYGYSVNDLRLFPVDAGLWPNALYPSRIANPTVWAISGNAYAEFARENPWYAAIYRANDPARLNSMITIGRNTRDALQHFGNRQLLAGLIQTHRDALSSLSSAADAELDYVLQSTSKFDPVTVFDRTLLDIYGEPWQSVNGWPVANVEVTSYDAGMQLGGSFNITPGAFLESTLFANQHNLGVGALSARVRPFWSSRYCQGHVSWSYVKCYARANTELQIFHQDAALPDQAVYVGPQANGTTYVYLGDIPASYPNYYTHPIWEQQLSLIYNHWTAGDKLFDQTVAKLQTAQLQPNQSRYNEVLQGMRSLFTDVQTEFYQRMEMQLGPSGTGAVPAAAKPLSAVRALIEAYVSLGFPQSMDTNQLIHGLLRGSDFQIDAGAARLVYTEAKSELPPEPPDVPLILGTRLDALHIELEKLASLEEYPQSSPETHPYMKYALANLADAGAGRLHLANDDKYVHTTGSSDLTVSNAAGVLANDAPRPNVPPGQVGYNVVALFDSISQPGGQRTTSAGGTVWFASDGGGGFTYSPPAGFNGTDSFQYVARGDISGTTNSPLFSNVATVYICVSATPAIFAQPQPVTVAEGQPAVLRIGVSEGSTELRWRKNGTPLCDSGRIFGTQTDTLVILSAEMEDVGSYDVELSGFGSLPSQSGSALISVIPGSLAGAKRAGDGVTVDVSDCVVTRVWPDFFYLETTTRSAGIGVAKTGHGLSPGDAVALSGIVYTDDDGERYISASHAAKVGTGEIKPLGLVNRAIGGSNAFCELGNGQIGVTGGHGLNNVGLLVRTCGEVAYVDSGGVFFEISDGSIDLTDNPSGTGTLRVTAVGLSLPSAGDLVVVTGISSLAKQGAAIVREILASEQEDVNSVWP